MMPTYFQRFQEFACLTALVGAGVYAAPSNAQEPKRAEPAPKKESVKGYEETILTHFKKPTDTAALLAYLKEHSALDEDLLAIPDLIKQLGDDEYSRRQAASKKLIAIGLPAFMPLLAAMSDRDAERAELAKSTIGKMDRNTHTIAVPPVTIRLLMRRKPPELLETLLRYLPFTTDPEVEEDLYYHINELALVDGKINPVLMKALDDKLPARRALAGCIVARAGTPEQKMSAYLLLRDADANVRLCAAQGYLAGLEKTGLSTLVDLLEAKPMCLAWQAEELLIWAAGEAAPKELVWSGGERAKKAKAAWQQWLKENEAKLDLSKVGKSGKQPRLYWPTHSFHRAPQILLGSDGQVRWEMGEGGPRLMQSTYLSNDHFLGLRDISVEERDQTSHKFRLSELTFEGKAVRETGWESSLPMMNSRLEVSPNGMSLINETGELTSIGLEGRITARINTAELFKTQVGGPYVGVQGLCDNLRCVSLQTAGHIDVVLMDSADGAILKRHPLPDFVGGHAYFTEDRGFLFIGHSICLLENSGVSHIIRGPFDKWNENEVAIAALRNHRFVAYDQVKEQLIIYSYSPKLQLVSSTKCNRMLALGDQVRILFPLVSVGFR